MFGWREKRGARERVDLLSSELFEAMRASEEEIDETALSPDLLSRVQSRIAIKRRRMEIGSLVQSDSHARGHRSYLAWATAAAAILLALTFVAHLSRTNRTTSAPREIAKVSPAAAEPAASTQLTKEPAKEAAARLRPQSVSKVRRHQRVRNDDIATFRLNELMSEEQQATEFLPLTFVPEGRPEEKAGENRQIVRVTLPRTALLAFGVPMNMERVGELVTADVMFGEDGVAHAIRFVH
jgi:hypothetical protein